MQVVAEDPMLAKEEIEGLGDGKRSMSTSLTSDEKEVLGGVIGRL